MIETEQGIFNELGLAILSEARPCPVCKTAHFFFVNRNGRTTCASCAPGDHDRHEERLVARS